MTTSLRDFGTRVAGGLTPGPDPGSPTPSAERHVPTILVVEDSPTQAEWVRRILSAEGYLVRIAPDGAAGIDQAMAEPPDMILSDVDMPGLDGFELCRQLKGDSRLRLVPFVMLTQRDRVTDLVRALEVGADNYITKPLDPGVVVERVHRILRTVEPWRRRTGPSAPRLSTHAEEMVLSLERTQVVEMLMATAQKLEGELGTVGEVGLALTMTHDLDELLAMLAARTLELSEADVVTVGLKDSDGSWRMPIVVGGSDEARTTLLAGNFGTDRLIDARLGRRELVKLTLDDAMPIEAAGGNRTSAITAGHLYPLVANERLIGALGLWYGRARSVPADEVRRYRQLGNHAAVAVENARLFTAERELRRELEAAYRAEQEAHKNAMFMLAAAVEARDGLTAMHLKRVRSYAELLARAHGLPETTVTEIGYASMLHDIGKLNVPDDVLGKPGPLSEAEWIEMRRHPVAGALMLGELPFFATARDVARCHHERWDGTGYPAGIAGDDIPLAARITAVADIFDALTTRRHYKEAWPEEAAIAEIRRISGTYLDPVLVGAFLALYESGVITAVRAEFSEA